jgi:hypothetical protein
LPVQVLAHAVNLLPSWPAGDSAACYALFAAMLMPTVSGCHVLKVHLGGGQGVRLEEPAFVHESTQQVLQG